MPHPPHLNLLFECIHNIWIQWCTFRKVFILTLISFLLVICDDSKARLVSGYRNKYQVKNGQQGLVGFQWCLHDGCVNLQSKLTQCTMCFKLLISQSHLLYITCTGICCQYYFFFSHWPFLNFFVTLHQAFISQQNELLTILHNQCTFLHLSLSLSLFLVFSL